MSGARSDGIFYGWYIVAALFFAQVVAFGARQGFGVFVETWQNAFGTGVATVSVAAAVGWLVNGVSQPILGRWTDRHGGRPVLIASVALMGLGSVGMALAGSVAWLVFFYGIVISFASGGSFVPASAVVARWFSRRRGTASAVLTAGGSGGGLVFVPLLAYLLILSDWRTAWVVAGGITLVLALPLIVLLVRNDPADVGAGPDGDPVSDASQRGAGPRPAAPPAPRGPLNATDWHDAFRSAPMWQLSLSYWVCGVTTGSIAVHYVRWATSEGISPATAALAFGVLSAINAAGVIAVGIVSDRMPRKTLLGVVYLVRGVAFLLLVVLPGPWALWGFALVGGMSWLATVPLTTSLAADVYGLTHLGTLAGMITLIHQLGGALAVYLFGLTFDAIGSYDPAFLAGAVLLVGAGILSLAIRERAYSVRYAPVEPDATIAVSEAR